jgi:ribonuclease G
LEDEIEKTLDFLILKQNEKHLTIAVHPYIYAYLKKGFWSILCKWCWKYKQYIKIIENRSFQLLEFRFFNQAMDEINLWTASRPDINSLLGNNEELS